MKRSTATQTCPICALVLDNANYQRHINTPHQTLCPICGCPCLQVNTNGKKTLDVNEHLRVVHESDQRMKRSKPPGKAVCPECGQEMSRWTINAHKRTKHFIFGVKGRSHAVSKKTPLDRRIRNLAATITAEAKRQHPDQDLLAVQRRGYLRLVMWRNGVGSLVQHTKEVA